MRHHLEAPACAVQTLFHHMEASLRSKGGLWWSSRSVGLGLREYECRRVAYARVQSVASQTDRVSGEDKRVVQKGEVESGVDKDG